MIDRRYARLLARARNGDAAAAPLVGLIIAAVIYLLLFTVLMAVTGDQTDTNGIEYRVLADRAESALSLLLGGTGEALNVTANPYMLMSGSAVTSWTAANGVSVLRETKDSRGALKVTQSGGGLALNSSRIPIHPEGVYRAQATLWGSVALDVAWFKDDEITTAISRNENVALSTGSQWTSFTSGNLEPPDGARWVSLELRGSGFWTNHTVLVTADPAAWENAPDGLLRFSLLEEDLTPFGFATKRATNVLDYNKLGTLRRGEMVSRPNGGADYPDVKAALGIGSGYEFHIRTFPVFPGLDDNFEKDAALDVAYLGDYYREPGATPPGAGTLTFLPFAYGPGTPPTYVEVPIRVDNTGDGAMAFRVETTLTADSGAQSVLDNIDTPVIASGGSVVVTPKFYGVGAQNAWKLGSTLQAKLLDPDANSLDTETSPAFTKPGDGGNAYNVKIEPGYAVFQSDGRVSVYFDHFDAAGKRLNAAQSADVVIVSPSGATAYTSTISLPKNKAVEVECTDAACFEPGTHTVIATVGGRAWVESYAVVAPPPEGDLVERAQSKIESGIVGELVKKFTNLTDRTGTENVNLDTQCTATTAAGDKYFDTKTGTEELISRLYRADGKLCYHLLIIGSGVEHNALTSADVKYGIAEWVDAGGTLVVLGSSDGNVQWLSPVGGESLRSASGGIGAPDPTHPVLTSPDRLAYKSYKDPGVAWELKAKDADDYTHVLVRDQTQQGSNDMLAVSAPGAFGLGTVVLSAYMPYDLMTGDSPEEREEAKRFLHNLVAEAYSALFVDFGPSIPPGAQVASTSRLALVPHPLVPGALTQIEILIYVFQ